MGLASGVWLARHVKTGYSISLQSQDAANATSAAVGVSLSVQNLAPMVALSPTVLPQNGAYAGTITVTEWGRDAVVLSLTGTDAASFAISNQVYNATTGITTATLSSVGGLVFNAATKASYSVTVNARDSLSLNGTLAATLTVGNTLPSAPTLSTTTVNEGSSFSATLSSLDANNDALTFTLSGADAASFQIAGATLTSRAGVVFDAKASQTSYALTLTASDSLGATASSNVTVTVANLAPSAPTLSATTVSEGGSFAATLSSTDPGGDSVTYALSGADASFFELVTASGVVSLASKAATTFVAHVKSSYALTLTASDSLGASASLNVTITVTHPPPSAPTLSGSTVVTEGASFAATLTSIDPSGDTVTLALSGADAAFFELVTDGFGVVSLASKASTVFHLATKASYALTVTASDSLGASASSNVSITVANPPPSAPTLSATSVSEGSRA